MWWYCSQEAAQRGPAAPARAAEPSRLAGRRAARLPVRDRRDSRAGQARDQIQSGAAVNDINAQPARTLVNWLIW